MIVASVVLTVAMAFVLGFEAHIHWPRLPAHASPLDVRMGVAGPSRDLYLVD